MKTHHHLVMEEENYVMKVVPALHIRGGDTVLMNS